MKPPISKAKMNSLTRGAIKAIKFYKHVVQSVEKFIQKVSKKLIERKNTPQEYIVLINFWFFFSYFAVQTRVQGARVVRH